MPTAIRVKAQPGRGACTTGSSGLLVALIGLVCGVAAFFVTGAAVMGMAHVLGMLGLWLGVTSLVMLYRPEVDHGRVPAAVFAR